MSGIRYTAAKTSRIKKKPLIPSVKKMQQDLKKILPARAQYLKNLNQKSESKPTKSPEKLVVTDYNVELDYQLGKNDDIVTAVDTILQNQWSESTKLHSRYEVEPGTMEQMVFLLKGLSSKSKADIMKFRKNLSLELITVAQLYSIFQHQGNTFVDKNLEIKIRQGKLRKFIITNASPVILRSLQKYQSGKITYGFENVEIISKTEDYYRLITKQITTVEQGLQSSDLSVHETEKKRLQLSSLTKFYEFVLQNPTSLFIDTSGSMSHQELSELLTFGFVTLTSNHLQEIECHQYSISYPGCGSFLKLINAGRVWLVKYLTKAKYNEVLEDKMFDHWEGLTIQGTNKMNNFRAPFYGYDLNWLLADSLGAGIIDVFNTPVGRGWRLTGKV